MDKDRKTNLLRMEKIYRQMHTPDHKIVKWVSGLRKDKITLIMRFFTRLGDGILWTALSILFLLINLNVGLALTFSILIQLFFQVVFKNFFIRQRPYIRHEEISNLMLPPDKFSFPSGHTAAAFAVAFSFYYFYPVLFTPFIILASLIGISRIYLGLHYPTDVLAGLVLGFVSARVAVILVFLLNL